MKRTLMKKIHNNQKYQHMDFNYLKKNQTKPEVSRLLSNVCDLPKRKLGLWERNPYPREWIYKSIENL
jgi:hypothetical protein